MRYVISNLKQIIFFTLLGIVVLSCKTSKPAVTPIPEMLSFGFYNTHPKEAIFSNGHKEVVIVGIAHVGVSTYYQNIRKKVDSLKKRGFDFLYEHTKYDNHLSAAEKDIYQRKFRKIMGIHISEKGYLDEKNNKLGPLTLPPSHGLMNQPPYKRLGINEKKDIRADFSKNVLIDKYEAKFGVVVLDSCDKHTPLDSIYACSPPKNIIRDDSHYIVIDVRNHKIVDEIFKSKNKKVAIIYGEKHIEGVFQILQQQDANWKKLQ